MSRYFGIPLRNGLPLGLGTVATLRSGGAASWTPLTLFLAGEQGGWYDPSDLSTMFQDSAGTTPVTAVEQPVGLWLDKRLGALSALGAELLGALGQFNSASGWNIDDGTRANISGGSANFTGTGNIQVYSSSTTIYPGAGTYIVTGTVTNRTTGDLLIQTAGGSATVSANGAFSRIVVSTGASRAILTGISGFNGSVDNVSIREVPGNHLIQPTSASRPTYSKRYNLLQYTEAFSDAFWTKTRVNLSTATSPIGTATASDVVPTTDSNTHFFGRSSAVTSLTVGATYVWTFRFKANGYRWVRIGTDSFEVSFDSLTGTVGGSTGSPTTSVSDLGNGWYELSITKASAGTSQSVFVSINDANSTSSRSFAGDGVSGVLAWGFDVRRTIHTTMGMPAYQRVTTATNYDESGFLPRLRFDGADDSMYSAASVNFSATPLMTAIMGETRLGSGGGMMLELTSGGVSGSFYIFETSVNQYQWRTGGSALVNLDSTTGFPSPRSDVITGLGSIAGDVSTLRINGAQNATSSADQGTGNYANAVLFVGRRNNASNPFNGDIFQLIIRGALTTGAELASAEQYVAARTGVTL